MLINAHISNFNQASTTHNQQIIHHTSERRPVEKTKVAIVGLGVVGTGVARLLLDHGDRTGRHAGRTLWLEQVVVRDVNRPRDVDLPDGLITDDLQKVIDNPEITVVAQLIGGLEPARTIMKQLLDAGKDIVTANKALLAEHGAELFDHARDLGRSIAFEASVAGGIPIITNVSQCLSANQIYSIRGILNGTSNFIVSQMEEKGADYQAAVTEAQEKGFAEADPTMDVDGTDAAQKLAILSHLAFGARVHWKDIPREGIDTLSPTDIQFASQMGYRIKLLAVARLNQDDKLELHVSPTLVRKGTPLAEVRQAYNAISAEGDAVGRVFFHGLGAGQMPTASAVVADMIDTCVGRTALTFRTLELWSEREASVDMSDHACAESRYYLRFMVADRPGVMGRITTVLGSHQVSIASVFQHEPAGDSEDGIVPLVIITHQATEGNASAALKEINHLEGVHGESVRMRIHD